MSYCTDTYLYTSHKVNTSKYFSMGKSVKAGWISMDRHKRGDSTTYNTCFKFKSSTKDLKPNLGNDESLVYYKSYLNTNPKKDVPHLY